MNVWPISSIKNDGYLLLFQLYETVPLSPTGRSLVSATLVDQIDRWWVFRPLLHPLVGRL